MRFIRNLLLLITLLLVAGFFGANFALDKGSQKMLAIAKQRASAAHANDKTVPQDHIVTYYGAIFSLKNLVLNTQKK